MTARRSLVVDTSSLILLRDAPKPDRRRVLDHLLGLILLDELCFPVEVARELGEQEGSDIHEWAKANQKTACLSINTWNLLPEVLKQVPLIVDPHKTEGEEADGHILAMALQLKLDGVIPTVLTEDRRDQATDTKRLKKMSLASACGVLEIYSIGLWAYLHNKGLLK